MPSPIFSNSSPRSKFVKRVLLITIIAALLVLALWSYFAPKAERNTEPVNSSSKQAAAASSAPEQPIALTVTVATPEQSNVPNSIKASGNISAWQEAIISADTHGLRISEVLANVGDRVSKNKVLVRFDNRTLSADNLQAQAALAQADANLENIRNELKRSISLFNSGFYSQAQVDQAKRQERVARAQRSAASAALESAKVRLAQGEVRAPDDGIISSRSATLGAVAAAGQELFRLIRQGRLEWRAELTAEQASLLRPGIKVKIYRNSDQDADSINGTLRSLSPSADPRTRIVIAYVDLDAASSRPNSGLVAGLFVEGEFKLTEKSGLSLPQQALIDRDGFHYVFVIDAKNIARQRKVEVGVHFAGKVEIRSGITAQDQIAIKGAGFLNDGDLVKIVAN